MTQSPNFHLETLAVHAGVEPDPQTGAVMTPIYQTSTFAQADVAQHKGYDYSRSDNPTRTALHGALAALEGGTYALAFASGMAAIDTILRLIKPGEHVLSGNDVYGGTFRLFDKVLSAYGIEFTFTNTTDETAVSQADIICAATSSYTPVFDGRALKPGAHVNGVGSFRTTMQEIDLATVQRSLVVVDSREAMWEEAGDLVIPLNAGDIAESHIHAELGELVSGAKPGRTSRDQITFFKSVGVAVQDAISGRIALENAIAHGLGTLVHL